MTAAYDETLGKVKRLIEAARRGKGVDERRAMATRRKCDDVLSEAVRKGSIFEPYLTPWQVEQIAAYIDDCCDKL